MDTKRSISVAIPVYKAFDKLSNIEKISLYNIYKVLGNYDIVLFGPSSLNFNPYYSDCEDLLNIKYIQFADEYFTGLLSYSQLLISLNFYNKFNDYKYVLICQLDVFIFEDKLSYFMNKDYDYIGAPWFEGYGEANSSSQIIGVGNGGFSLRKVQSCITILKTFEIFNSQYSLSNNIKNLLGQPTAIARAIKHEYQKKNKKYEEIIPWKTSYNEDLYWGRIVGLFFRWFRVASVSDAIEFAFEVNPRLLYKLNNNRLPMATHAWEKYDTDFWKEFLPAILFE